MRWGASSSRSGLACFASNSSTGGTCVPLKLSQTHEVSTQFHNLAFRKTKNSQWSTKAITMCSWWCKSRRYRFISAQSTTTVCHTSRPWDFLYTMQIARANAAEMTQVSRLHLFYITTFVGVEEHHETEDGKTRLPAEQEKSRLRARISFLLVSWDIDMSQRLYSRNSNIRVCC